MNNNIHSVWKSENTTTAPVSTHAFAKSLRKKTDTLFRYYSTTLWIYTYFFLSAFAFSVLNLFRIVPGTMLFFTLILCTTTTLAALSTTIILFRNYRDVCDLQLSAEALIEKNIAFITRYFTLWLYALPLSLVILALNTIILVDGSRTGLRINNPLLFGSLFVVIYCIILGINMLLSAAVKRTLLAHLDDIRQ